MRYLISQMIAWVFLLLSGRLGRPHTWVFSELHLHVPVSPGRAVESSCMRPVLGSGQVYLLYLAAAFLLDFGEV